MNTLPRFTLAFALTILIFVNQAFAGELRIERLTWAGVKMQSDNATVFIDAVGTDLWGGNAPEGLVPVVANTPRRYALITHTHNDHFDVNTLKSVLGERGYVICHSSIASHIASRGLRVIAVEHYQPVSRAGFVFTAIPASDGFGDEQVSWIIRHSGKQYLHAGDTLWHGKWGLLGAQYGPFDVVFLPINAPIVAQQPPSEVPAVMQPEEAVDAALLLRANRMVPIHYGLNDPPHYVETENPIQRVVEAGKRRGLVVTPVKPGDVIAE